MSGGQLKQAAVAKRFSGFASTYDRYRPKPPRAFVEILTQLAKVERPRLVIDLGCGTGLATRIWSRRAARVIGIDVSTDMITQAERATRAANVDCRLGSSSATGLPARCADIVTCSQSLHWMEPEATFREVARILRRGGVFAAIDCDWPPLTSDWRADVAYREFQRSASAAGEKAGVRHEAVQWPKSGHLERMRGSGRFRHTVEILAHSRELGNAERIVGLALSFGSIQDLLKAGLTEKDLGVETLRRVAMRYLGDRPQPWYFSYRMRVAIV